MHYTGIDEHKDNCYMTIVDAAGIIVKGGRLSNEPTVILDYFQDIPKPHQAVVESTASWYWLSDLLEAHGNELVLAHARYIKAIVCAKVKTDKVDSRTLAQLLRTDFIPRAYKIRPELRNFRDLMRARIGLIQRRTSSKNSIHRIGEKFNCTIDPNLIVPPDNLPESYKIQLR